jgi:RNA polymerase sigma-70 factor (ECF subfamily)
MIDPQHCMPHEAMATVAFLPYDAWAPRGDSLPSTGQRMAQRYAGKTRVTVMQEPVGSVDSAWFEEHWPQTQPVVRNYVLGLIGRCGATDEIVQEVAYTCLRRIASFDSSRNFTAWALGVARLEVFTHRRRQILLPLEDFPDLEMAMSDAQEINSNQDELRRTALLSCHKRLSDQQRQFVDLRYGENCSHDEMAKRLGMRIGSIKVAMSRIRSLLRKCVEHRLAGTATP